MVTLVCFCAVWWFAGWKLALCVLLPALAVESVWWVRQWRNFQATYRGDIQALEALQKLGKKLSTSALAESAGILDEIQAIIEEHNRRCPEDLWAGVADVRDELAGKRTGLQGE